MNKIISIALALIMALVGFTNTAHAGFPIGSGRWLLVPTYNHYGAKGYWDNDRVYNSFKNNGKFTSNYFGLYGGYGINRNWEFIFNIPVVSQTYSDLDSLRNNVGFGDVSLGFTYYISHFDYYKHLSLTGSLIMPFYSNDPKFIPYLGYGAFGFEGKMGLAGTNQKVLKTTYYDIEGGFRQYFADDGPTQFFANITLGVPIDEDWKVSGTINGVTSSSSYGSFATTYDKYTNNAANKDFDYLRFSLAVGRKLNRNFSLWGSVFTDVTGRHIGKGSGFSIFGVIKF